MSGDDRRVGNQRSSPGRTRGIKPDERSPFEQADLRGRGAETDRAVVAFGGDVIVGQRQNAVTARDGPARALAGVPELAAADLAIVNLEGVVANTGAPVAKSGALPPFHFRGRPELLAVLAAAGIDVVATANNHSGDYGTAALLEQLRLLDGMNLGHAGSGRNLEAAWQPVLRRAGRLTVATFAVDATMPSYAATADQPGTCYLSWDDASAWRTAFAPRIAEARRAAHVVLVVVHCGVDFETRPRAQEVALCHALVEAGADAVLGSSSHVPQGIEIHRGRPIVYDAGNLLWTNEKRAAAAAVFSLLIEPNGVCQIRVTPVEAGNGTSRSVRGERGLAILADLRDRAAEFGTTLVIEGDDGLVELPPPPPRRPPTVAVPWLPPPGPPPGPATTPPPGCVVAEASAATRVQPISFGPLTLVGLAVAPATLTDQTMLWIDAYWTIEAAVPDDLWIAITGQPLRPKASVWEGDHEPCDWMWPTSRWTPGTIYRDRYGLRPPRRVVTSELDVWLGLRRSGEPVGVDRAVARVTVVSAQAPGPPRARDRPRRRGNG